jgi:hypothetical protein
VPATYQCDVSTKNPDKCGDNGAWGAIATCSTPAQICQVSGGVASCQTNTPYPVGNSSTVSTSFAPPNAYVYFIPVTPPHGATVQSLDFLASAAVGTAKMYLYSDSSNAPGSLIGSTAQITVAAGINSGTIVPASTSVTAGTQYWIGAEFYAASGTLGIEDQVLSGAIAYRYSHTAAGFGGAMPSPMTADTPLTNTTYQFYMQVQTTP